MLLRIIFLSVIALFGSFFVGYILGMWNAGGKKKGNDNDNDL